MTKKSLIHVFFPFGVLICLFSILYIITLTPFYKIEAATLTNAIVIDVAITIPLIYFLLIRKRNISKFTVIPVVVGGVLLASVIVPKENQMVLTFIISWIIPLIEIFVVGFLFLKVRKIIHHYSARKKAVPDFFSAFKMAATQVLPLKIANILAMEIGVLYYGFFHWKKRTLLPNEFSYHINTGTHILLYGMLLVIAAETIGLHFILSSWNATVAWVVTGLSVYSAFQVFGIARSLSKRPIAIENDTLRLNYGVLNEATIPMGTISAIEFSKRELDFDKQICRFSPFGLSEGHNIIVTSRCPITVNRFYGFKKQCTTLAFFVNDVERFKKLIREAASKNISS